MMKSLKYIIVLLLMNFLSCARSNESNSNVEQTSVNTGEVILTPKHFQIGEISKSTSDTIIPFVFDILNNGKDNIKITSVEVNCNCVTVLSHTDEILPQEHGFITGHVNIAKQYGHLSKAVFVNYNEAELIILRIVGDISD